MENPFETNPKNTIEVPISFETSAGSWYTYKGDGSGEVNRIKIAEDLKSPDRYHTNLDLTLFIKFSDRQQEQRFLEAYQYDHKNKRLAVYEKLSDGTGQRILKFSDVTSPDKLFLCIVDKNSGVMVEYISASAQPKIGMNVFDQRIDNSTGDHATYRHIGHPISRINNEEKVYINLKESV